MQFSSSARKGGFYIYSLMKQSFVLKFTKNSTNFVIYFVNKCTELPVSKSFNQIYFVKFRVLAIPKHIRVSTLLMCTSMWNDQFSSVQFSSVQFSSVQFSSVQFSSVQFSSVQFSSVQFSSVQFSSVQFSSVQFSSVQFSSVITN